MPAKTNTRKSKPKPTTPPAKKPAKKTVRKSSKSKRSAALENLIDDFNFRVRMYRHGLGDCFLLSLKKKDNSLYHIVIDCGVLMGTSEPKAVMGSVVKNIAQETKSSIDLLVITHQHYDHLSGFSHAKKEWDGIKEIKAAWMGWTENPLDEQARRMDRAKKTAFAMLSQVSEKLPSAVSDGLNSLLSFGGPVGVGAVGMTTSDALEYVRERAGENLGVSYLEPGETRTLPEVDGVRVHVLGPPREESLLLKSHVTKKDKEDDVVYGMLGQIRMLAAALGAENAGIAAEEACPFTKDRMVPAEKLSDATARDRYQDPEQEWRKMDSDWLGVVEDLAIKLDSDTNNTSLVLAFEFIDAGFVALFVGDAQVGNWQSWQSLEFLVKDANGQSSKISTNELLERTRFYKVGHHGSHNATLQNGGLEMMKRTDLVAFIPVDKAMAAKQGRKVNGVPKGWEMPAHALFAALMRKTGGAVVLSDRNENLSNEAVEAGVRADSDKLFVEWLF